MRFKMLPVLGLAALALAACSGGAASGGEAAITVEASALKFQPVAIEMTASQPVRLVFENKDSVDHDFSVMEFPMEAVTGESGGDAMAGHDMSGMAQEPDLHVAAVMGSSASLQFTPTKPGTYEFFCTVPGHREAGMIGTLVVKGQ